jgi:hypothetical protein
MGWKSLPTAACRGNPGSGWQLSQQLGQCTLLQGNWVVGYSVHHNPSIVSKFSREWEQIAGIYFEREWEKVRFRWVRIVGGLMIFREEVVWNEFWHSFTCFAIFLFLWYIYHFCPVNRKKVLFFLITRAFLLFFLLFFLPGHLRLQARSLPAVNFLWWRRGFSSLVSSGFPVRISTLSYEDGIHPTSTRSKRHQPSAWHG